MTCATFAIAGCGSDTTKTTADNGTSVTWSETFDGTKTDFAVKSAPLMQCPCPKQQRK